MIRIIQTGVTEIYVADSTSNYSNDSTWFGFQLQSFLKIKVGFESRGV